MLASAEAISADRPEKRIKDRAQTEKAIFNAARSLLAEEGFQGFGINAVARRVELRQAADLSIFRRP